ncbi:MAG: hypothetical protein JRN21_04040 [Nitrososphaerota archaeon]|nr:hypothetical protein [Nitrososphaerota archaeon]
MTADANEPKVLSIEYLEVDDPDLMNDLTLDENGLLRVELVQLDQQELDKLRKQAEQDGQPDPLHRGWEDLV